MIDLHDPAVVSAVLDEGGVRYVVLAFEPGEGAESRAWRIGQEAFGEGRWRVASRSSERAEEFAAWRVIYELERA